MVTLYMCVRGVSELYMYGTLRVVVAPNGDVWTFRGELCDSLLRGIWLGD